MGQSGSKNERKWYVPKYGSKKGGWRQHIYPKCSYLHMSLHGVAAQNIVIVTAVRISSLAQPFHSLKLSNIGNEVQRRKLQDLSEKPPHKNNSEKFLT
jgi:hypothetical protein